MVKLLEAAGYNGRLCPGMKNTIGIFWKTSVNFGDMFFFFAKYRGVLDEYTKLFVAWCSVALLLGCSVMGACACA
jgi:hypothetical protein